MVAVVAFSINNIMGWVLDGANSVYLLSTAQVSWYFDASTNLKMAAAFKLWQGSLSFAGMLYINCSGVGLFCTFISLIFCNSSFHAIFYCLNTWLYYMSKIFCYGAFFIFCWIYWNPPYSIRLIQCLILSIKFISHAIYFNRLVLSLRLQNGMAHYLI